jgi:hypothetical protein
MTKPVLIGHDHLDITGQHEPGLVVAALYAADMPLDEAPAGGFVWLFLLGSADDDPTLAVGVRGQAGALTWYAGDDELAPANGLNEAESDNYWTWFGHEAPMPPRSEMPIAEVYRALAEWISTHRRPTCVQWLPVEE